MRSLKREVVGQLKTNLETGPASGDISDRLSRYGQNRLPTAGKRSPLVRFFSQFNNVLIYVLLAAGLGKVFLGEWLDASVIFGVVFINGLLGFVQRARPKAALDSIRNMLSAEAMTVRDGNQRMIPAEELRARRRRSSSVGRQGAGGHSPL